MTGKPKTYATPQAVFDAYWRARDNQDIKALFGTIAPDQQELIVAEVIHQLALIRLREHEITDGMEKYGLDFERQVTTDARELRRLAASVENPLGFLKAAGDRLTKANERMAKANAEARREMLEVARKAREAQEDSALPGSPEGWRPSGPRSRRQLTAEERERMERAREEFEKPPRLTDLEIVGDRAKGTCVRGGAEFNMSSPIAFVKIGDAWYVSAAGM